MRIDNRRFHIFVAVLIALGAEAALAAPVAVEPRAQGSVTKSGEPSVLDELELFRGTRISLVEAIAAAEKRHAGARTADAGFDGSTGRALYKVMTFEKDRIWENLVDGETGEIIGGPVISSIGEFNAEARKNLLALRTVRQQMSDAVHIAEQSASRRAVGGSLTSIDGRLNFTIVVDSGSSLKQVVLEPPAGKGR
ncbi:MULTISPECIES: PepSY domain-containing protein [Bradyrhizobium]|uniref:PepSY domain-containing protein n=1 Tax=Bradyrhizobium elkanii TaxID=29448 RepID=UPI000688D3E4|nr:PepSY domain-containing protein [Bradyrhizobium elkanii]